jgi:sarcosine oxidase
MVKQKRPRVDIRQGIPSHVRHFDAVVVGCGANGSSASYSLTKRGFKVLALEQFQLAHDRGSSHGRTRIIRLAYHEDPRYVPLLRRAFSAWRELERNYGKELLRMTGCLTVGEEGGEIVSGVLASAKAHGLPHRKLAAREAEDEFPAFKIADGRTAVFEENAGLLFPEECIRAFVGLAEALGCEFRFSEQVTGWNQDGDGVVVQTARETYSADRIVLCAGPWMGRLTGGLLPLKVERQVPFWFSSGGNPRFSAEEMPVFIMEEDNGEFYGVPDVGHGVKVGRHHGGESVDPDAVKREVTKEDAAPVEEFVSKRLPALARPHDSAITCLYTNTPDLNFVVGIHPEAPSATIVSACSGHGFKFASVMGEVVADLATSGKTAYDISFLSPERFSR